MSGISLLRKIATSTIFSLSCATKETKYYVRCIPIYSYLLRGIEHSRFGDSTGITTFNQLKICLGWNSLETFISKFHLLDTNIEGLLPSAGFCGMGCPSTF